MTSGEAFVDLTGFGPQLEALQRDPNTRIVGSLGRMAAMQAAIHDPYLELRDMESVGITSRKPLSIDVLGTKRAVITLARLSGNTTIDGDCFDNPQASIRHEPDGWHLKSTVIKFDKLINPHLMQPLRVSMQDITVVTVPLLTHRLLHKLRSTDSEQDQMLDLSMGYALHKVAQTSGNVPKVDRAAARPFKELALRLNIASAQKK